MIHRLADLLRSAPASCAWLAILLVTTILQRTGEPAEVARWLAGSSTDLAHLFSDPLAVLLASLAWLDGAYWLPYVVMFAIAVIPMERRLGFRRWAALGLAGHVVGTGVSQGALWVCVQLGVASSAEVSMRDIGVSYALIAFVGGAAQFVTPQWQRTYAMTVTVAACTAFVVDPGVTNLGHLTALVTGLLIGPVVVARSTPGRRRAGLARPTLRRVARSTHMYVCAGNDPSGECDAEGRCPDLGGSRDPLSTIDHRARRSAGGGRTCVPAGDDGLLVR